MFTVIIPAFNEEKSLGNSTFISDLIKNLNDGGFIDYEILIVNDGSTDKTEDLLNELKKKFNLIKVLSNATNQGYGTALKIGINHSKFDTIIICDIDGTYPADQIPNIINRYKNSQKNYSKPLDMIVAKRTGKHYWESFIKTFLRYILKFIVEWTSGHKISDINSGLRIFSKKTVEAYLPKLSNFFSFSSTLTVSYLLTNKSIEYYPVKYLFRKGDQNLSKVKLFRDSLRTLQYVFEATIFYNPLKFFLLLSIILFIIFGILFILYILYENKILMNFSYVFLFSSIFSFILSFFSILLKKEK